MSNVISDLQGKALLAPLAGVTNLPFRLVARRLGCSLCFTEMISANGLIRESAQTLEYLKTSPEDLPLGIQLFGADPLVMARAAVMVAGQNPALIDINMGCPVKKVVKTGSGAVLMKNPLLAGRIIAAVVRAAKLPVTVKIRSGWSRSSINAVEIAKIAEDSGSSAIIVHGRTADQGFSGVADWNIIGSVKRAVRIPVIGNGDIREPEDALRMLAQTGCDAVMVGRGALGNPWIFMGIHQLLAGEKDHGRPSWPDRQEVMNQHWEDEVRYCGRHFADRSFRKHLLWYTKGLAGSARLRETLGKMTDSDAMRSEVERYFRSLEASESPK
ncbi:MAG: tRNA dihydrouridine synthase DusB [Smithellaceae bacterium]|nr:tRNA dihydrouridine synthase DusB [Smithellaceae bacterium]MDD3848944.1 tRNA dihydrouridine synthase DusB [Smithellaceae bacterium]